MITRLGLQKLREELDSLETELRRTVEERAKAAAEGDLRENSAYLFYGERAEVLRTQIAEVKTDLKAAKILPPPTDTTSIGFGHKVSLLFLADNRPMTITLVGKHDSRLKPDWISIESPIGIALTGQHLNDIVDVNGQKVKILDVAIGDIQ